MSLLRRIWETLMQLIEGRRFSPQHEARWLNLLGYALRPGYGLAVDDWRVTETWRHVQGKLVHNSPVCRNESWVLWRTNRGGSAPGTATCAGRTSDGGRPRIASTFGVGSVKGEAHFAISEFAELWRLLGSLELLTLRDKTQLGDMLLDLLTEAQARHRSARRWYGPSVDWAAEFHCTDP